MANTNQTTKGKTDKKPNNGTDAKEEAAEMLPLPELPQFMDILKIKEMNELVKLQLKAQLHTKINIVNAHVEQLENTGVNTSLSYKFIRHQQITREVVRLTSHVGITIVPSVTGNNEEHFIDEVFNKKYNEKQARHTHRVRLLFDMHVTDTQTGYSETYTWQSAEQDSGGKSNQQAVTIGIKYFKKNLFNITDPTETDPDAQDGTIGNLGEVEKMPKEFTSKFMYTKHPVGTTNWTNDNVIDQAVLDYDSAPSRENAMKLYMGIVNVSKMNKKQHARILKDLQVTDVDGNYIPESDLAKLLEKQKAPVEKANEDLAEIEKKKDRVFEAVEAVKKAKTMADLKKICSTDYKDIYPNQGENVNSLVKPFTDEVTKQMNTIVAKVVERAEKANTLEDAVKVADEVVPKLLEYQVDKVPKWAQGLRDVLNAKSAQSGS